MKNSSRFLGSMVLLWLMAGSILFATGSGDATVKIYNSIITMDAVMAGCNNNYLEIWIKNDAPLYELSLSFQLTCLVGPVQFVTPFGSKPVVNPILMEMPAAAGYFDLSGGVVVEATGLPNRLSLRAEALNSPLPASATSRLCYRLRINGSDLAVAEPGFCVDNVVHPVTGEWSFNDGADYAPKFNNSSNASITQPTAPQLCWGVVFFPCGVPEYTATPPARVVIGHCETFVFDFDGTQIGTPAPAMRFEASVGTMNFYSGVYSFPPQPGVDSVLVTTYLNSECYCGGVEYSFVVVYTNSTPSVSFCQPELRVKSGLSRSVEFIAVDPDLCDTRSWSLELVSTPAPESNVSIDPQTGIVSVDAAAADLDEFYDYRIITTDNYGAADSCGFQLSVISCISGDADQNGILTISDVVYIITYIFGSPQTPDCEQSLDADCNGFISISDAVFLINYVFLDGPAPC